MAVVAVTSSPKTDLEAKALGKSNGARLVLWGAFKKLVVADRIAPLVADAYDKPAEGPGLGVAVATAPDASTTSDSNATVVVRARAHASSALRCSATARRISSPR